MNFTDKRTQRRLLLIEKFAIKKNFDHSRFAEPKHLHNKQIEIIFGHTELTELLLIRKGNYEVGKKTFSYIFNWNNLQYAFEQAELIQNFDTSPIKLETKDDYEANRSAKLTFEARHLSISNLLTRPAEYYEVETCPRLFADFQSVSKEVRTKHFNGWYDYDIEAASYSLLHQHLMINVLPWWSRSKSDNDYPTMRKAYSDKDEFRNNLATELNVPEYIVKKVLACILFDAKLTKNYYSSLFKMLQRNEDIDIDDFYFRAQTNDTLTSLINEIRDMWPKLMIYWNNKNNRDGRKKFITTSINGKSRFRPAKFRSYIYFELERHILNIAKKFVNKYQLVHWIHDGMFSNKEINISFLEEHIFIKSGFRVKYKTSVMNK